MRAVFLDRDGTLNKEVDVLRDLRQLRVLQGVPAAIRVLNKLGYLVVVVTNQPVIARGWLTPKGVEEIHDVLRARLKRRGAHINAVYYCPHHPSANLKKYRAVCKCRKPATGMIDQAIKDLKITRRGSFMIGDATSDMLAGKKAKLTAILVKTGYAGKDGKYKIKPDFTAKDLQAAVKIIKRNAS
jgi:D,D-heptose 1,7-bisphosphate phosphatase